MKAISDSDFAKHVMDMCAPVEHFEPTTIYDPDGDCIEFIAKNDDFYAERIDDLVTVYYSRETGEIIGSLIKGVQGFFKTILERNPGFKIEINDGPVKLEHLFLAKMWSAEVDLTDVKVVTYRKLIEIAEETDARAELCST
jgi:hypothetical protein